MKAAFPESDGDQGSFTFRSTIQDRFESYHAAHPEVYFVLVQLCGLAKQRGITKLGVSLLWPGMLSLSARHYPRGGASMFAVLSAAGTLGCALAPWLVGLVADAIRTNAATPGVLARVGLQIAPEPFGLRVGLLAATACPVAMLALVRWINRQSQSEVDSEQ